MSKRQKPLSLSRETVRELSDHDGAKVAGGIFTLTCNVACQRLSEIETPCLTQRLVCPTILSCIVCAD